MLNVPRSLILRYIVAVLAIALALGLTSWLWPVIKPNASLLFFAAVMFSAWYGGLGAGLLSTVLATLAIIYFFESPIHAFEMNLADILRVGIFVLVSLLISSLNGLRQQTEKALRKREEQIRLITDSVPTLISYVDAGQRYRYNNRTYEEWFGHCRTDITGKHLKDVMGESAYQAIHSYVEAALLGQEVTYETAISLENAGLRYIRATYVPDFGKQQQPKGFVALVDDITERKQAEEALKKERDFSSAVLSTVGSLVVVLDQQGRIAQFNKACEKTTGYSFDEVRGKYIWDLFLIPEEVEPVKAVFENLRTNQLPSEYENYWLTKDGSRRLIAWSNTTLKDDEDSIQYVIGTGIDITERKQAEEARRQSEERLRLALDAAQMGTWDWNLLTGQVTWSETHEQLFGIASGTFEGTYEAFLRRVHPEDREAINQLLNGVRLERGIYDQEIRVVWDDGSIHWIAAKGRFYYNPIGQPVRMIGVVLGITKRKQAEELLQTFALELERQVEARTVELASTNAALEAEIVERQRVQEALFQSQQSIQNLYEIVAAPYVDFKEKIQKLLAMGCDRFGLDMGILAQITRERYQVVEVQFSENLTSRNNLSTLSPGDILELSNTYCNETLQAKEPVSFEHAGRSNLWKGHPCYRATQLEAYIATPIIVAGEVYGTLNFSSPTPRTTPFQPADKEFLKLMALWVGGEIARQQAEEELYQREQQFKALVENTPDVIIRCDRELRYAYVNPAVERNTGVAVAQFIGKTSEETGAPSHLCQLWNETLLNVFQTGTEQVIEYQAFSVSGMRTYQSRIVPELDKEGATQYALVVARDITELKQAEEERAQLIREQAARRQAEAAQKRSAFLVEVSTVLASSLDYETTLKSVARLAVPYMADWCSVDLASEEGPIRRVEVAHLDPAKVELAKELLRRYPPEQNPQSPIMKVLQTGKSELVTEVPDSLLTAVAQDSEYLRILRELNPRSYMVVPLRIRGQTLGVLSFA
ncbi:MAG: PAS domain S-box protein, partial [Cyanobacteriota bacterium]